MQDQKADLDVLIFEGRNTSYGAFLIRKLYPNNLLKAFVSGHILFSLAVLCPFLWDRFSDYKPVETEVALVDPKMVEPPPIDPKTPPPPPLPSSPPPPQVSTVRFVPPEVAPDEEVLEEDPPKQEEMKDVQAATETVQGDPSADPNELSLDNTGTGEIIGSEPEPEEEAFLVVDQMPQFPDGDVQEYFSRNLKYPSRALQRDISGKVHLSFIVMPDGSISDIQVLKGIGSGCDEEAVRVVSQMPKWIPGKQGGRAVKVKIIQPIKFSL